MERLGRYDCEDPSNDEELSKKIWHILGAREDMYQNDCDARYFDFSSLPKPIKAKNCVDMYLLFGITHEGKFITHWIDRWVFDS